MEREIDWLKANRQFLSLRAIEMHLKMPDSVLRKYFIEGVQHRDIPTVFLEPLAEWIRSIAGMEEVVKKAPVKPVEAKLTGTSPKKAAPPMPVRKIGEAALDFAERKNIWKRKYGGDKIA